MKMLQLAGAASIALGSLAAVPAAHADHALDEAAVRALYAGAVVEATTSRGGDFVGRYQADGTMTGEVGGGQYKDSGTWNVTGGKFCRQWSSWDGGTLKCFDTDHVSGNEYRSIGEGGTGSTTFTVR